MNKLGRNIDPSVKKYKTYFSKKKKNKKLITHTALQNYMHMIMLASILPFRGL